jgi:DNA-binding transcriptional regulator YhcF (GntR family)
VNNGHIFLSHRDAAKAMNVHRNSVGPWFQELQDRGFIRMTQAPHLGPSGIGKASVWALDEETTPDMKPALKRFMSWTEKQNPRTKFVTPRHSECDSAKPQQAKTGNAVLKIVT